MKPLEKQNTMGAQMGLRDTLSTVWGNIQLKLFPSLEKALGKLSQTHKTLVKILELIRIEHFISCSRFDIGRPKKSRIAIARAFVAKVVFKFSTVKQFLQHLQMDEQLKLICGFNTDFIPSESTFSRAFAEFAEIKLPQKVHEALIKDCYEGELVGHISKDSTPLEAREKHLKKRKPSKTAKRIRNRRKTGELNRRQKQLIEPDLTKMIESLPTACDKGMKRSAQGYTTFWKGYKLHAAVDDHCIPLAVIITSASLNDCEVAIPLAEKANKVVSSLYDLMDAAYDHPEIRNHSISLGHKPIIDVCPTGKIKKAEKEAEKARKKLLNFKTADDRRYAERFKTERFNALYKDYFGGRTVKYRGHSKVSCDVQFGVLALAGMLLSKLMV